MAAHGTENELSRRITYLLTENMALCERVRGLESSVRELLARLDQVEAALTECLGSGEAVGDATQGE